MTVVGRILCDSNGKLNAKSLLIEGSRDTSAGRTILVDVGEVKQYSLFPGQIVAMNGTNSTGNKFVVKNIYQGIPMPLPAKSPDLEGVLQVIIAAGPFTTSDSLSFEPLADLIKYLQKYEPDVCILLGPFLDVRNAAIERCALEETFEDFFKSTIKQILRATGRLKTTLVFVPSQRDVHHDCIYPQPPFVYSDKDNESRVQFVGDPCTLTIHGVVFGITSTDILFHLGAEEISCQAGCSDRLARLTQHIITQHSYYPLYPPAEDVFVDYDHFDVYAKMPVTPHVLITPSDLRYFIKDVCGCCCVNPGRLAKGQVGGTFARLMIKAGGDVKQNSLVQNIAGQVVRI